MKKRYMLVVLIAASMLTGIACAPYVGHFHYTRTPYFAPTDPGHVRLLRVEPRRPHIQLGEVWLRPEPGMSARFVENTLRARAAALGADALVIVEDRYFNRYVVRNYWHGHRYHRERSIVGIAIRYR